GTPGRDRRLVGFELIDRGIARAGHEIVEADRVIGHVTSGAPSPTLGKSIGLGYVPQARSGIGQALSIRIRTRVVSARVVERPFYDPRKARIPTSGTEDR
ncbi:MAG TPA: hypothetical protein ENI85_07825, partial [Deltaproteobacteria bacterium]|nr:hypothetical protein [Deltaproteobacteria bacterium]